MMKTMEIITNLTLSSDAELYFELVFMERIGL